jgi:hypothetical protein
LGLACWLVRNQAVSRATKGLVTGLLFYNVMVAAVFVYSGLSLKVPSSGLWPPVVLHVTLAIWCAVCLRRPITPGSAET